MSAHISFLMLTLISSLSLVDSACSPLLPVYSICKKAKAPAPPVKSIFRSLGVHVFHTKLLQQKPQTHHAQMFHLYVLCVLLLQVQFESTICTSTSQNT